MDSGKPDPSQQEVTLSVFAISVLAGISAVSCTVIGMTLEKKATPVLEVERVEKHGVRVFLISGISGNSGLAVLGASAKKRLDGVVHVVVTQVLVTPLLRDGSFSVEVPDDGTVKKIVFGKEEHQIWPAGS